MFQLKQKEVKRNSQNTSMRRWEAQQKRNARELEKIINKKVWVSSHEELYLTSFKFNGP